MVKVIAKGRAPALAMKRSTLSEVLNRLLFEKKIRVTDLAREVNIPQPTISRIATGKSKTPHSSTIKTIADYFSVSAEQLKGEEPLEISNSLLTGSVPQKNVTEIMILTWEQAAYLGDPKGMTKMITKDVLVAPSSFNKNCFALTMKDSSMDPYFPNGSTLILDPSKPYKDRSFVLVKLFENNVLVFRQILFDGEYKYLKPINPDLNAFKMRILNNKDKILGTLLEVRRDFSNF